MYVRISVTRNTGVEMVQVDMPSWQMVTGEALPDVTAETMKGDISHILSIMDERAGEAQLRQLAAYGLIKYFPLEQQSMIIQIVDVINGKADAAYIARQWQAAAEENAALEAARTEALYTAGGKSAQDYQEERQRIHTNLQASLGLFHDTPAE